MEIGRLLSTDASLASTDERGISVENVYCGYRKFKAPIPVGFVLSGQHTNLYAVNQGDLNAFRSEIYPHP